MTDEEEYFRQRAETEAKLAADAACVEAARTHRYLSRYYHARANTLARHAQVLPATSG